MKKDKYYCVENILEHRMKGKKKEYLIKWLTIEKPSWEP
jgi:hypothetical protein